MTGPKAGLEPDPTDAARRSSDTIPVGDVWRILAARHRVVLAIVAATVVTVGLFTLLSRPVYRAEATVQIERRAPEVLTFQDVVQADSTSSQDFYQTQIMILQSRAVLDIALARLDLEHRPEYALRQSSPLERMFRSIGGLFGSSGSVSGGPDDEARNRGLEFLQQGLRVRLVERSHLLRVSFKDSDAELARDAANSIVEAFQEFNLDARYSTTAQARDFLTKQVAQLQTELADRERTLQEYSERKNILAARHETQDIASTALAELNSRYVEARSRHALAEARNRSVRDAPPDALDEVLSNPLIKSLTQQLSTLELRYQQLAQRFGPDWPAVSQLRAELDAASVQLAAETETVATQVRNVAQADYDRAEAEVRSLKQRVEDQKHEVQRVNWDAIEYASLKAEIETRRKFLDELLARQNRTDISDRLRDTGASNVRVVDRSETPRHPVSPKLWLNLGLSLVLGLTLGCGAALVSEHFDNTLKDENDITRFSGLPVVGRVSLYRPAGARGSNRKLEAVTDPVCLAAHWHPRSAFAEACKSLRTSILLSAPNHPPRHIVVTSCDPQDGKSTVSTNLAVVLTQLGRRVVLVDGDLRRPVLHRLLGLPNDIGLSSFLSGNAELRDIVRSSPVPNLSVITSGPIPPTPAELIASARMDSILEELAGEGGFDHIVFDSPPALQVADSVLLASRAETTLMVVRVHRTTRESLVDALKRLRQAHARVTGVVLNGVSSRSRYEYYYHSDENEAAATDAATPSARRQRDAPRPRNAGEA